MVREQVWMEWGTSQKPVHRSDDSAERRHSSGIWVIAAIFGALLSTAPFLSAAVEERPDKEAAALVSELLSQRPTEEVALEGRFKIWDSQDKLSRVQIKYSLRLRADGWEGIYEAGPTNAPPIERLIVIHQEQSPNQYLHWPALDPTRPPGEPIRLTGSEAALAFAGSDFWVSDLGLEFLHWPKQRLIRYDKPQMRNTRPCKVLESFNPMPTETNYAKVVSWIDTEYGGVIHADAYDSKGKKLKVFSLKSFKKGQVTGMRITNAKAGGWTDLELQPVSR